MTHIATTNIKNHVSGYINWLFPSKVNFSAVPRALTLITCTFITKIKTYNKTEQNITIQALDWSKVKNINSNDIWSKLSESLWTFYDNNFIWHVYLAASDVESIITVLFRICLTTYFQMTEKMINYKNLKKKLINLPKFPKNYNSL